MKSASVYPMRHWREVFNLGETTGLNRDLPGYLGFNSLQFRQVVRISLGDVC